MIYIGTLNELLLMYLISTLKQIPWNQSINRATKNTRVFFLNKKCLKYSVNKMFTICLYS